MAMPGVDSLVIPPPNTSHGSLLLGITGTFLVLGLLCFSARLYVRLRIVRIPWWDDLCLLIAATFNIIDWILLVVATHHGLGRPFQYVTTADMEASNQAVFYSLICWCCAVTLIKISMALMLLRIMNTKLWRIGLTALIVIQIATFLVSILSSVLDCSPAQSSQCFVQTHKSLITMAYVASAIFIASDIIFSFLPVFFIYKIRRPLREKIILTVLMGLGIFASSAAIVKVTLLTHLGKQKDIPRVIADSLIFTNLEESIGIMAASIPILKTLLDRTLERFGLLTSDSPTASRRNRGDYVNTSTQLESGGFKRSKHDAYGGLSLEMDADMSEEGGASLDVELSDQNGVQSTVKGTTVMVS